MIIFHVHLNVCGTCHSREFLAHRLVEAEALLHLHMGLTVLSEGTDPDPSRRAALTGSNKGRGRGSERLGTSAWQGGGAMMCVVHDTCYCGGSNL